MVSAIIVAGGDSTRMKGINKQLALINNKPVIIYSLEIFNQLDYVDEIILVAKKDIMETITLLCKKYKIDKVKALVEGQNTRQASVLNGLKSVNLNNDYVLIHDGARPVITKQEINDCYAYAKKYSSCAIGTRVVETVKNVQEDYIISTVDRSNLVNIKTPQIFSLELYKKAVQNAVDNNLDFTDDCQLIEAIGEKVFFMQGSNKNIKITSQEDLLIAKIFLDNRNL